MDCRSKCFLQGYLYADEFDGTSVEVVIVEDLLITDIIGKINTILLPVKAILSSGTVKGASFGETVSAFGRKTKARSFLLN